MLWDKILIATRNKDKVSELKVLLSDLPITIVSIDDVPDLPEVLEDAKTLAGNAIKKARELSNYLNMPALADDTGLEVDALNGRPGIRSARYAGENARYSENVEKLLLEMQDIPDNQRQAHFRTVIAIAYRDKFDIAEGICRGFITSARRGSSGFGYDPVFFVPELKKTFAEMNLEDKNAISHRGMALQKVKKLLRSKIGA